VICCACGTGGTLAGLAAGLRPGQTAIGFSALKGGTFLNGDVRRLQAEYGKPTDNWSIETDHHFGGFAKRNQ
jgi:1-aminocyclopropane-1-carboxylate deaminase